MSRKLSQDKVSEIIKKYQSGLSGKEIAFDLSITPTTIYKWLKYNGINRRSYSEAGRRYTLNEHYFDLIDDENKAYYFGLLMADGYNSEKRGTVTLILVKKDEHIIRAFSQDIQSNKPIAIDKNKTGSDTARLEICSRHFSNMLSQKGCVQAKTFKLEFPVEHLRSDLIRHFIRVYFDGDGCISSHLCYGKNNLFGNSFSSVVTFVSTENFCLYLKKYFKEQLGINSSISCRHPSHNNNNRTLTISGSLQVIKLMEWMYNKSTRCFERKKQKFEEIKQKLAERRSKLIVYRDFKRNLTRLTDITRDPIKRWNARYFITHGLIKSVTKSLFTEEQVEILKNKLNEYGNNDAIPKDIVEKEFIKAKASGFPYYKIDKENFLKGIATLKRVDVVKRNGLYCWGGKGTELASYFHPHMFECKSKNRMSAMELYNDDVLFKKAIWKLVALYPKITESNIREMCRNDNKSSRINNFPPRVAISILKDIFGNKKGIKLLDPCAGFSGRLIGSVCSGVVGSYTGIDISSKTVDGLLKTKEWLDNCGVEINIIHNDCLAEMDGYKDYDIILTAPPFLDMERYIDVEFETDYDKWISNFITPFVQKAHSSLCVGGKLAVYLEKIDEYDFFKDFEDISVFAGFNVLEPIKFNVSYGENNKGNKESRAVKVLVFERRK